MVSVGKRVDENFLFVKTKKLISCSLTLEKVFGVFGY